MDIKTPFRLIAIFAAFIVFASLGCRESRRTGAAPRREFKFDSVTNVAELVQHLVSPSRPIHPTGETDLTVEEVMNGGFLHPQVIAARLRLIKMGTRIYPALVQHIQDNRYSYSVIVAAWSNGSVGDAVMEIMAEGIAFSGYGYKWRKNKTGSNGEPDFRMMASEAGWIAYADHASSRTKAVLQKEFVQWKLDRERRYGFTDAKQEKMITEPYINWLAEH